MAFLAAVIVFVSQPVFSWPDLSLGGESLKLPLTSFEIQIIH
jgi:hypothetical protein